MLTAYWHVLVHDGWQQTIRPGLNPHGRHANAFPMDNAEVDEMTAIMDGADCFVHQRWAELGLVISQHLQGILHVKARRVRWSPRYLYTMTLAAVAEPFPIFRVGRRHLLFDVDTVMHARRRYHICGVLIGNIPSANQQNIFSGMPLELLPEEVRLLVERGHAFVIDDVKMHSTQLQNITPEARAAYLERLAKQGAEAAEVAIRLSEEGKARGLAREKSKRKHRPERATEAEETSASPSVADDSLFAGHQRMDDSSRSTTLEGAEAKLLSPTASYPPLECTPSDAADMPDAPPSYPLYKYLHDRDYWLTPGLRFGCQYSVYPGDPLRFHSHFLAVSTEWDEEIDLLSIVGGGRLGTGVKKSFILGGNKERAGVRAFSIEWAAM